MNRVYFFIIVFSLIFPSNLQAYSYDTSWYTNSKNGNYYEIKNSSEYEGLIHLANVQKVSFKNDTIAITADLSLSGLGSLKSFDGIILGNNKTIKDLKNPMVSTLLQGGIIEGLIFDKSCSITTGNDLGMVARECSGTIKKCINYGTISCSSSDYLRVGGICGSLQKGKIIGCINNGEIYAAIPYTNKVVIRVGGICGYMENNANVIGCSNYATITTTAYCYAISGGIVGDCQLNSKIENCMNYGFVSSTLSGTSNFISSDIIQYTGGIAGNAQEGSILNMCTNKGNVSNNTDYVSGIIGHAGKTSLYNCINYGKVTSTNNYFYSCASGICGYYDAVSVDNNKDFLNCINIGSIICQTRNATATAAGICNNIKKASIGNLLNLGTVSASATGTNSNSFQIQQYETTECKTLSEAKTISEANDFINKYLGNVVLVKWENNATDNTICLSNHFSFYIDPFQGTAFVQCFSEKNDNKYLIKYVVNGNEKKRTFTEAIQLSGLIPNTTYNYTIQEISSGSSVDGVFSTLPIEIALSVDSTRFTKAHLNLSYIAKGCNVNEYGVKYRPTESNEWTTFQFSKKNEILKGIRDNSTYDIMPYVKVNNIIYDGKFSNFSTKELIPSLEQIDVTSSTISFKTLNSEDLVGFKYGIVSKEKKFYANEIGIITVDSLKYFEYPKLQSFVEKYGNNCTYNISNTYLIMFSTEKPLQVSYKAAMVRVLTCAGKSPQSEHPYNKFYIEYRNTDTPDNIASSEITPIKTDDYYEYCGTIKFNDKNNLQYRLKASTSSTYYHEYEYKYGDWVVVNTDDVKNFVVKPIFTNIKVQKGTSAITISCSNVMGEEDIKEYGIEYKIKSNNEYLKIPITPTSGLLSRNFTTLATGQIYQGHFYNIADGSKYISDEFTFTSNGDLNIDTTIPNDEKRNKILSVIYPDDGVIKQNVSYGQSINFEILPPQKWVINTVLIDDVDVTSNLRDNKITIGPITNNTTLRIVYKNETSNVDKVLNDNIHVYSKKSHIYIQNLSLGTNVSVYDISGTKIYTGNSNDIKIGKSGVYIIKIKDTAYKLYVD